MYHSRLRFSGGQWPYSPALVLCSHRHCVQFSERQGQSIFLPIVSFRVLKPAVKLLNVKMSNPPFTPYSLRWGWRTWQRKCFYRGNDRFQGHPE